MKLKLDIVTPEQILISMDVDQVVVPGADGEFGVLEKHAHTISNLRPGVVRIYTGENKVYKRVLVSGGFVEVTPDRCTVLATEAHDFDNVSKEELEKRHLALKKIHDEAKDEHEKKIAAQEAHIAQDIVHAFIHELDNHK